MNEIFTIKSINQKMQTNQNDAEMAPEPSSCKRMAGVKTSIPIVIGSIAQAIKRPIIVQGYDW